MTKRIAILPARGGSRRIPDKNIKDFYGKPLIYYALQAAKDSGVFDVIHVSTDSDKIYNVAKDLGFEPDFMRPDNLADDYSPMFDVAKHVTQTYKEQGAAFDTVCIIFPTAPLIKAEDLAQAAAQFDTTDRSAPLMSIAELPCPVEWAYKKNNKTKILEPVFEGGFLKRSQDLTPAYFEAAMFLYFSSDFVLNKSIKDIENNSIGYEVPLARVTDIDTEKDWVFAEKLYAVHLSTDNI